MKSKSLAFPSSQIWSWDKRDLHLAEGASEGGHGQEVRDCRPLWHLRPKCKQRAPSWSLESLSSGRLWEAMEVWHHPLIQGEKKFWPPHTCVWLHTQFWSVLIKNSWSGHPFFYRTEYDWLKSCFYPGSLLLSTVSQVLGPGVSDPSPRSWPGGLISPSVKSVKS